MEWVDLFCGSDGTLGVVLEAELALLPQPKAILSGVVFFPDDELTLAAVEGWRAIAQLRMLEYLDAPSLEFLRARYNDIHQPATAFGQGVGGGAFGHEPHVGRRNGVALE